MKSCKVLKLLNITRPTLCRYVKNGTLKCNHLPNGFYDYDEESVYKLLNKNIERKNVIYSRVSTQKQKNDLENQKKILRKYCSTNGSLNILRKASNKEIKVSNKIFNPIKIKDINAICDVAYFKWQPTNTGCVFQPNNGYIK